MGFFGGGASASNMVGATSSVAGTAGLVPAPAAGDQRKFLRGDATLQSISGNTIPITPSRRSGAITHAAGVNDYGSRSTSTGYVLCTPVYIRETKSYTTFSVYVSGAGSAGSVGQVALYQVGSSATPTTLVCNSGTFATDSTGTKQPTMTSTVINDGWYFGMIATNSAANVSFYGNTFAGIRLMIAGSINGAAPVLIDYSDKAYANLWPSTWDGTNNFSNNYYIIMELT